MKPAVGRCRRSQQPITPGDNRRSDRHEHCTDPQPATAIPGPVSTLGSAPRWVGHDCPDRRYSQTIDALTASVWFVPGGQQVCTFPPETRVLVALSKNGANLTSVHRMIAEVNWCTRRDAIEVGYRPWTRRSHCGRRIPSLSPVSVVMSYRPTRLYEGTDPTNVDVADISQATTW